MDVGDEVDWTPKPSVDDPTVNALWVRTIETLEDIANSDPVQNFHHIKRQIDDAVERLREEFGCLLVDAAMARKLR